MKPASYHDLLYSTLPDFLLDYFWLVYVSF